MALSHPLVLSTAEFYGGIIGIECYYNYYHVFFYHECATKTHMQTHTHTNESVILLKLYTYVSTIHYIAHILVTHSIHSVHMRHVRKALMEAE